jgi:predicted neuraminidase
MTGENCESWSAVGPLNNPEILAAIQPAILVHSSSSLQILCRSKQKRIADSWSDDRGKNWQPLRLTNMPNPDSGIDAVQLRDGRSLLVYNPSEQRRTPLCVAVSEDGFIWRNCLTLEDQSGEYSYPAVIQLRWLFTSLIPKRHVSARVLDLDVITKVGDLN